MRRYFNALIAILILKSAFLSSCGGAGSGNAVNGSLNARVQRGDYLVNAVANCMHCHADRDFTKFSGPVVPGTEGKGGQRKGVPVLNITPAVLGTWTDQEIERAITTGINNVGDTLFVTMPYMNYKYLSKYDAESIVAYLRTLKPLADSVPKRKPGAVGDWQISSLYDDFFTRDIYQTLDQSQPDKEWQKGRYLVTLAGCLGCHTNLDRKALAFRRDSVFAGGLVFNKPSDGFRVVSANITPDTATGIGAWTEEAFLAKFKGYREKEAYAYNPGRYNSEMPWTIFAKMSDDDIRSMYRYLRTVKAVRNKISKWPE